MESIIQMKIIFVDIVPRPSVESSHQSSSGCTSMLLKHFRKIGRYSLKRNANRSVCYKIHFYLLFFIVTLLNHLASCEHVLQLSSANVGEFLFY